MFGMVLQQNNNICCFDKMFVFELGMDAQVCCFDKMFVFELGMDAQDLVAPLLFQLFRRELRFFHHCDGGVRTPVEGMEIQKVQPLGQKRTWPGRLTWVKYHITKGTRDDKRDKFTLQTDLSKCGHATIDSRQR